MTGTDRPDNGTDRWQQAASGLSAEIAPERDLWPDIAARIEAEPHAQTARGWSVAGALAAAVALVALSSLTTLWISGRDAGPEISQVVPPPGGSAMMPSAAFGPDHELGPKYRRARNELTVDLESRLQALPPSTRHTVERNLEQIRVALAEINAALAEDPGNMLLQQLLLAAYQDELTVLTEVNRMARSLPTRTEI